MKERMVTNSKTSSQNAFKESDHMLIERIMPPYMPTMFEITVRMGKS